MYLYVHILISIFEYRKHSKYDGVSLLLVDLIDFWCFNATFSNMSAISWRSVLVVEEAGVPGKNHLP